MVRHSLLIAVAVCAAPTTLAADRVVPSGTGRMLQQLDEDDWILQAEALEYLGDHRIAEAVEPVREILNDEKAQPWVRGQALVALARIQAGTALDDVSRFIQHEQPHLRAAAGRALEELPADVADPPLAALIKDDDPQVRYCALAALARHKGEAAWPTVEQLTQDLPRGVYQAGIRALAFVGTDAAIERLEELTANQETAAQSIRGISGVPNSRLIPLLLQIGAMLDSNDDRFAAVLTALAQHDRTELLAAMDNALKKGGDETTRTIAVIVTRLIRAPEIGEALRRSLEATQDIPTIQAGLAALGCREMQPDQHQELFVARLDHADVEVRALAIRCLAHCKAINLYDALGELISDEESAVVHASLGVLRNAPVRTAPRGRLVEYLQVALDSENEITRTLAYDLLGHAGTEADFQPALAVLGSLLRSTDDVRRTAAAEALGKLAPREGIERLVRTQGYVSKWMVLGTFLNDMENKAFDKPFPPEEKIDFEARYKAKYVWKLAGEAANRDQEIEREIGWVDAAVSRTNGQLVLPLIVPPPASLSVAYAVADFSVPAAGEILLHVDGDDAFRIWLNGEKVAEKVSELKRRAPSVAEQKDIKITLKPGPNRFIVKTSNIDYHWWIRLRLTDTDGRPIEVPMP